MVKRNWKKIIASLILIVMFFPVTNIFAVTPERAGEYIANYAYNFCKKYGCDSGDNQTIYSYSDDSRYGRQYGYALKYVSGTAQRSPKRGQEFKEFTHKWPMDCVCFTDMVVHQSLGIGPQKLTEETELAYFVTPQSGPKASYYHQIGYNQSEWKPGDILCSPGSTHVAIYLGNKFSGCNVAHSTSVPDFDGAKLATWDSGTCSEYYATRVIPTVAEPLTEAELQQLAARMGGMGISGGEENVPMSEFYYNGIPNGEYSVSGKNVFAWLIEALRDIFEFLLGICAYVFRMVFVGWTALIENLITYAVETIMGNDKIGFTATFVETDDNITIEKIVFDEEEIFDVNFFDFDSDEEPSENPE